MSTTDRPTYLLRIRPERDASDPGGIKRVRSLLKVMLRSFGLRCVEIAPTNATEVDDLESEKPADFATAASRPAPEPSILRPFDSGSKHPMQ